MNFIDKSLVDKKNEILLENQLLKNQISHAVMFIKESLNKISQVKSVSINKNKNNSSQKNSRYRKSMVENYSKSNKDKEKEMENNIVDNEDLINNILPEISNSKFFKQEDSHEKTEKDYQMHLSKEKDVIIDLNQVKNIKSYFNNENYGVNNEDLLKLQRINTFDPLKKIAGSSKSASNKVEGRVINNIQIINKINNNYNNNSKSPTIMKNNSNSNMYRKEVSKEIIKNKNEIEKIRTKLNSFVKYNQLNKREVDIKEKKRKLNILLDENIYLEGIVNQLKNDFDVENDEKDLMKAQEQVDILRRKNNTLKTEIRNSEQKLFKYNLELLYLENKEKEVNERESKSQNLRHQTEIKNKHNDLKKEMMRMQIEIDNERESKIKKIEKIKQIESKLLNEVESYSKIINNQEREIVLWEKSIKSKISMLTKKNISHKRILSLPHQSYKISYLESLTIKNPNQENKEKSSNNNISSNSLLQKNLRLMEDFDINEDLDHLILPSSTEEDPDIKNLFNKFNNDKANSSNVKNKSDYNHVKNGSYHKIYKEEIEHEHVVAVSKNGEIKENNDVYVEKINKINSLSKLLFNKTFLIENQLDLELKKLCSSLDI